MSPEGKTLLNIIILGLGFMVIFTAFGTCGNIEQTVIKSFNSTEFHGSGYTSMAIIYAVFSASNLIAPSVIAVIGPQLSLFFSGLVYSGYIAVFIHPYTSSFYTLSVLLGIAAAVLWTAQGNLLTINSKDSTIGRNSGIFWALMQFSLFFGNLYIFFAWRGKSHITGVGEILGGGVFGILDKCNRFGRNPVVFLGLFTHIVAFFLIFLNIASDAPVAPEEGTQMQAFIQPSVTVALICSFLLGLGDSCFNTQLISIVGFLFREDSASAFAVFKFVQSITAAVAFFYSNYFLLHWQLLIMVLTGFLGTITFFVVEWGVISSRRDSDYDSI
ncbi:UNC93-like protein MFSD11 [Sinocyclocheilus grahami]|uniref:UNC93-like protein MFSD11 n=1 Tax=Sinocyclocheilus grahami TaxID=75366 RepID=UPI0007AC70F0|nr:PREDICTED: UNC93-like protein MFSD11 [Sinocyclocheilus grahami]